MRALATLSISLFLCGAAVAQSGPCDEQTATCQESADRSYGTALTWEPDNEAAALEAQKSGKLLLMLHLSGHFEDPART